MNEDKLRLDLQFFSEEGEGANDGADNINIERPEGGELNENTESVKPQEEKTFTQADIDRIVKDRLARAKKDADDAAEKARLEEQGQYKDLLDKANEEIETLKAERAAEERKRTIESLLAEKGLTHDEVTKYAKYVDTSAQTEDELVASVNEVYDDFATVKQAQIKDPAAGFGDKKEAEQKGDDDFGRDLFKRLGR